MVSHSTALPEIVRSKVVMLRATARVVFKEQSFAMPGSDSRGFESQVNAPRIPTKYLYYLGSMTAHIDKELQRLEETRQVYRLIRDTHFLANAETVVVDGASRSGQRDGNLLGGEAIADHVADLFFAR